MTRSIQQLPNNTNSSSVVEVATATGFSAGDLVYYTGNDYKPPSGLATPSSVNFPIVQNLPTSNSTLVQSTIQPIFGASSFVNNIYGGTNKRFAAVLTNGNIVQAFVNKYTGYATYNGATYFQVVNSSGAIVVSPTVVDTTHINSTYPNAAVVALTGGGFAVAFINTTGATTYAVNYAIYTNTGSVTTAVQQDTGVSISSSMSIEMTALANGGFAIAVMNTSGATYLRAYGATGTPAYSWVTVSLSPPANMGQTGGYAQSFAMTSRSDSSVFICNINTNLAAYNYSIYNSSGTALVSNSSFSITSTYSSANYVTGPDATILADGTTIVIGYYDYNGTYSYPCVRFLPTGNTLGAQQRLIPAANANYNSAFTGNYINVLGLSGGGFAAVFSDGLNTMQYAFYNSSGTVVSPSNASGAIPQPIYGGYLDRYQRVSLIEITGYLNLYWPNSITNAQATNQFFAQINETTYQLTVTNYVSSTATTLSATPGSIVSSNIRPSSVAYYAGSTSTTTVTNSISSVVSPSTLSSVAQVSITQCVLTNGGYVIAYATSGGVGNINVFNSSNNIVSKLTFSSYPSTSANTVRMAALSNGGFAIAYPSLASNTTINIDIYSSSYSLVTSVTQSTVGVAIATLDMAGLSSGGFVLVYLGTGNYCYYSTWSNTGTSITSGVTIAGGISSAGLGVASNGYGGFGVVFFDAGNTGERLSTFVPRSSTAYANVTNIIDTSTAITSYAPGVITSTPSGGYVIAGAPNSTSTVFEIYTESGTPQTAYYSSYAQTQPYPYAAGQAGIGFTGAGALVLCSYASSTTAYLTCLSSGVIAYNGAAIPTSGNFPVSTLSITITSSFYSAPQLKVGPLLNNNCLLTWLDSNQYPRYAIYSATPGISNYTLTAGTSISAQVPINPNPNSPAPSITGVFAGVAATSASSGSTGQLVINGLAQLNSNYSASNTGAFDYTGLAVDGVKGTYNGRNVNLQGNS